MRFWVLYRADNTLSKASCPDDSEGIENLLSMGYVEVSESVFNTLEVSTTVPTVTVETLQQENKLLKAQLQAQSDRADFIEDCIAEMATQVYGGV